MLKPFLALSVLGLVVAVDPRPAVATTENVCTSPQVECSSGSQLCATITYDLSIFPFVHTPVTINCYQPG